MRNGTFRRGEIFGKDVFGKARLLLVQIHRQQFEADRGAPLQILQQREERVAVLAAAQADHDAIAFDNHVEVGDGLAYAAQQFPLQQFCLCFSYGHSDTAARNCSTPSRRMPIRQSSIANRQCYTPFMKPTRVTFLGTGDAFCAGGRHMAAYLIESPEGVRCCSTAARRSWRR